MAKFNEILIGRWNRMLQKVTGIKGGAVASQLASDIQPVLPLFSGVEHRYLESWERFAAPATVAAQGVGNSSALRLRNPAGSNVILVVESAQAANNSAVVVPVGIDVRAGLVDLLAGTLASTRLDPRGRQLSTGVASQGTSAISTPNIAVTQYAINVGWSFITFEEQEVTVMPGDSFTIQTFAVLNTTQLFSLTWRERFLEDSERT